MCHDDDDDDDDDHMDVVREFAIAKRIAITKCHCFESIVCVNVIFFHISTHMLRHCQVCAQHLHQKPFFSLSEFNLCNTLYLQSIQQRIEEKRERKENAWNLV